MLQTLRNIPAYLRASRDMSPAQLGVKLLRRTTGVTTAALQRLELLSDPKLGTPERIAGLFDLLETQARERAGWRGIPMEGRNVIEIGCGALGGFAPVAIARGCASYAGIEPMWNPDVFFHPSVEKRYLAPIARHLGLPVETLAAELRARCRFDRGILETWTLPTRGDLVVSLSCLEHIGDLAAAARNLRTLVTDDARQMHLVNFSNHRSKASPFAGLYAVPPEVYRERYGGLINLMRPAEVLAAFRDAGFDARFVPVSVEPDALARTEVSDWWRERYSSEELATRTGLIVVG